jgi:pyruvate/2-oxoacid:ferredoxin oxidoreductase beta subunit
VSEGERKTYLNEDLGALPYCPGCGHSTLAKSLDKALVKIDADPRTTVLVTDIGCIGLTCRHFNLSAFHGLHGRSITYACGLKLARPELTGGLTSTTPWGNIEAPMDLCATTMAAGAPWVYRTTMFDKTLPEVLAQAVEQPGFAMTEVWGLCSAYYQPRNEMQKKELEQGLLADKPRPEYSERYRQAYEEGRSILKPRPKIEPSRGHALERQTGIIIAGSAGQKIKSAATILAQGAIFAGLTATQKDDYPITVKTGHSVAEIILSPESVEYTGIDRPDVVVVVSDDGARRVAKRLASLPDACVVYAEESVELPPTGARVRRFPFKASAKKISRLSVATLALATLLEETGFYPATAMVKAIETFQSATIAEINVKAARKGAALASSGKRPKTSDKKGLLSG